MAVQKYVLKHPEGGEASVNGLFAQEIVPIQAYSKVANEINSSRTKVLITHDDGIREGTTDQTLGKIKSAFHQWHPGNTTGGNASQVTDGGAFVLLMTRRKAEELGLT